MIATDAPTHIASMIVHCRPEAQAALKCLINAQASAEVGAETEGKLVVVLETQDTEQIMQFIDRIQLETGVYSATLVYHCDDADGDITESSTLTGSLQ